jgi:hypothetical protein
MRCDVIMRDDLGDLMHGVLHEGQSDMPPTVTVNGSCLGLDAWRKLGWEIFEWLEEES